MPPQIETDKAHEVLDEAKRRVALFVENNPRVELAINYTSEGKPFCVVRRPWNDPSLSILAPDSEYEKDLEEALNSLILPERLSAIYHTDTKVLEVPWTAFELPSPLRDIPGRNYTIKIGSREYVCRYGESSPRLLALARAIVLYSHFESDFRGMAPFAALVDPGEASKFPKVDKPYSFFLKGLPQWQEEKVVGICRYINFYNKYFDALSPEIRIHDIDDDVESFSGQRYVEGKFPKSVTGRELNPTLMSFWSAANRETDATRKFIYFYRLIEYVSFYHLDDRIRGSIKRALSNPNSLDNVNEVSLRLIEIMRDSKADDYAKFRSTVTDLVDRKHIERVVGLNKSYFSSERKFDGGFQLKPLLTSAESDTIGEHGMDNFVMTLRDIRNALSHGRDQKTGQMILPTVKNFKKLQPWVNLIETTAAEVILYEGIS